jgi:hypothetical protein
MKIPYPPEHYYQNQGMVPRTGPVECVTTSVVMLMNMMKDRLAQERKESARPDIFVKEYAARLDGMGWRALPYRIPSDFFLKAARGWMHPLWQAPNALKQFARELKKEYGTSFEVKRTSGNSLEDIGRALRAGNFVLVHGLWNVTEPRDVHHLFGGIPHTMLPVKIDRQSNKVLFLNPGAPGSRTIQLDQPVTFQTPALYDMPTAEFLAFWGRKSFLNLYTRPFTMTMVIPQFIPKEKMTTDERTSIIGTDTGR